MSFQGPAARVEIIVASIARVRGVEAIALGGSYSRGEVGPQSDLDIGVYYEAGRLDIPALARCLKELDDGHRDDLLNPPGAWGPWINGGAWLTIDGAPVDILLRDLQRVEAVLQDCIEGKISIDYQPGHPFGFVNTIYAAETHYCQPLWQAEARPLDRLKALLTSKGEYSPQMREALVRRFLWEAWFSLATGRKAAYKGDLNYAMGAVFRAVCAWVEVLFALNRRYKMNEKGALNGVGDFEIRPDNLEGNVRTIYQALAGGGTETAYRLLDGLQREMEELAGGIERFETRIR